MKSPVEASTSTEKLLSPGAFSPDHSPNRVVAFVHPERPGNRCLWILAVVVLAVLQRRLPSLVRVDLRRLQQEGLSVAGPVLRSFREDSFVQRRAGLVDRESVCAGLSPEPATRTQPARPPLYRPDAAPREYRCSKSGGSGGPVPRLAPTYTAHREHAAQSAALRAWLAALPERGRKSRMEAAGPVRVQSVRGESFSSVSAPGLNARAVRY